MLKSGQIDIVGLFADWGVNRRNKQPQNLFFL